MTSKKRTRIADVVVAVGRCPAELRLFNSRVSFVCLELGAAVTAGISVVIETLDVVVDDVDGLVVVVVVVVDEVDVVLGTTEPLFKK